MIGTLHRYQHPVGDHMALTARPLAATIETPSPLPLTAPDGPERRGRTKGLTQRDSAVPRSTRPPFPPLLPRWAAVIDATAAAAPADDTGHCPVTEPRCMGTGATPSMGAPYR